QGGILPSADPCDGGFDGACGGYPYGFAVPRPRALKYFALRAYLLSAYGGSSPRSWYQVSDLGRFVFCFSAFRTCSDLPGGRDDAVRPNAWLFVRWTGTVRLSGGNRPSGHRDWVQISSCAIPSLDPRRIPRRAPTCDSVRSYRL